MLWEAVGVVLGPGNPADSVAAARPPSPPEVRVETREKGAFALCLPHTPANSKVRKAQARSRPWLHVYISFCKQYIPCT